MSEDSKDDFISALGEIEKEKGISQDTLLETIENSLVAACKKNFPNAQNPRVIIDRQGGGVKVFISKVVVEQVEDPSGEIALEEARKKNSSYAIGDLFEVSVDPKTLGRTSAKKATSMITQKINEYEKEMLYNHYIAKEKDIINGKVQRRDHKNIMVELGKLEGILGPTEQIPNEMYSANERIKVYVLEIKQTTKGPQVLISRTHPELVKRLFEQEVPEIHEGIVEIRSISREAGSRTKMAVYTKDPNVDAVGACVGTGGSRVNLIVKELKGEKIDVINWDADPRKFIAAALSPSKVLSVVLNQDEQSAKIVVPDYQLSLAIGKEGQNARLAAKLTGWRIDIKSETQARETNFVDESEMYNMEALGLSE